MAVWSKTSRAEISNSFGRIDAEFYRPEYLAACRTIMSVDGISLQKASSKIDVGHVGTMKRHYRQKGVPLLQTHNVREFFLDFSHMIRVDPEFHNTFRKSQIHRGDVLIARSGSFGAASIYLENETINSADIIIVQIDPVQIDPLFAVAFMNSKYGSLQLVRFASGAVQGHVNLTILGHFRLPRFSPEAQKKVAGLVQASYQKKTQSEQLYKSALAILESELGLNKLSFEKPVGYTASSSDLQQSRRADAEFFNPQLRSAWKHLLEKFQLRDIHSYAKILKFSNPEYGTTGIPIVTQKHLETICPQGYSEELRTTNAWLRKTPSAILQMNDLLFYSVGAYLGKTNIWLNTDKAVHASFITMLRCHKHTDAGFLQILLNSEYGILQSKCFQSGTSQQYIYPKDIRKFLIPVVPEEVKREISKLVAQSFSSHIESKRLLKEAKASVERLINDAVKT